MRSSMRGKQHLTLENQTDDLSEFGFGSKHPTQTGREDDLTDGFRSIKESINNLWQHHWNSSYSQLRAPLLSYSLATKEMTDGLRKLRRNKLRGKDREKARKGTPILYLNKFYIYITYYNSDGSVWGNCFICILHCTQTKAGRENITQKYYTSWPWKTASQKAFRGEMKQNIYEVRVKSDLKVHLSILCVGW